MSDMNFNENGSRLEIISDAVIANKVANFLVSTGAYKIDLDLKLEDFFTWASGIRAPMYCNVRNITEQGDYSRRIRNFLTELIQEEFSEVDTIIGLATAGIGWVFSINIDFLIKL